MINGDERLALIRLLADATANLALGTDTLAAINMADAWSRWPAAWAELRRRKESSELPRVTTPIRKLDPEAWEL